MFELTARLFLRLLFLTSLIYSPGTLAIEWENRLDKDGVVVESRKQEGAKYEEFRAHTVVEENVASALALLQDTDACTAWVFRCKESRILNQPSSIERTFYQVTSLPFPARSRDLIFDAKVTYHENGSVEVKLSLNPGAMDETRHIRIQDAHGSYLFEPVSESQTRVTWVQYVDPAGSLPSWLVNSMLTDLPFNSLVAFRDLVVEPPYAGSKMIFNDEGLPIDISSAEE